MRKETLRKLKKWADVAKEVEMECDRLAQAVSEETHDFGRDLELEFKDHHLNAIYTLNRLKELAFNLEKYSGYAHSRLIVEGEGDE